jgi:hypothetical protein
MLLWLGLGYVASSSVLAWRLVTVVASSADQALRRDAIRLFGYLWSGGTTGAICLVVLGG